MKNKTVLYNRKEECCGCTACFAICPMSAISMVEDEEGFEYPQIDEIKCVQCNQCIKVCPIKASNVLRGMNSTVNLL
ncbi:MAG: NADH-quinone oxidoreductase subunit I [Lachnospira sp.]